MNLRFLADECCSMLVVEALKAHGYDIISIAQSYKGISDDEVIRVSVAENRILITEDKDFGDLIYAGQSASIGVIFMRIPTSDRSWLVPAILKLICNHGKDLLGKFIVVQPGRIRMSKRL